MARAALCLILLAGCGLASRDVDVWQDFQAGGGPPTAGTSFDSSKLLAPIAADVSKLSSVTLKAARLEATDGGNLSFVSGATLRIAAQVLPDRELATYSGMPAGSRVDLTILPAELKGYLQAGGFIAAEVTYSTTPVTARGLRLTLTLHASLF
ncbi:MAG TPA: hypothetical protein VF993_03330 [Myxococcales bacterium]